MKLNKKETNFVFMSIVSVFLLISNIFVFFSYYARLINYPKVFNKYRITDLIYYPNLFMIKAMKTTPNAYAKALSYLKHSSLFITITCLIILLIIAIYEPNMFKNTQYGTARWANIDDLGYKRFFKLNKYAKAFNINLLEEQGVVLGTFQNKVLKDNAKTHILLSAPTRTGKGVSVIIPTLVDSWKDSVFVLDIKGENYQKTAGYRQKVFGNKILKFSPKKDDSCKYNPLLEIRYMTDREMEDTKVISDLIVEKGKANDPFWEDSGSDFLTAVILYVLYSKNGKASLSDAVEFITDPSGPVLDRLQEIIDSPMFDENKTEDKKIIEKLKELYPTELDIIDKGQHPLIVRGFSAAVGAGEKVLASVVATVKSKLGVFEMPAVKKNTSSSDFRIIDLMAADKPISLYIVIEPGDLVSLAPLLRIFITQCVTLLTPEIDYTGKNENAVRFKHRLLMLMDEFPAIGKMELLEKGIGYVAGYGMKMIIVVQSLQQLNKIYTKDNAFMSNCQVQVFYTANDNETADYVSKSIGNETIKVGNGKTASYTGQPLITPDEMRKLDLGNMVILAGGKPPIKTDKILYFSDPRFKDKIDWDID